MNIRLIIFSMLSLFCLSLHANKTYVIAVGIADYKEINDLQLSENDAEAFAAFMSSTEADITLIKGSEATHVNIINAFKRVSGLAQTDDTVIFFFSGHGYEGGFCCWDMASNSPSANTRNVSGLSKTQLNLAFRYYGGLSYAEVQVLFRNCRARTRIVLADACFSGGLRKGLSLNAAVQSARKGDVVFFLSSQTNETSLEMPGGKNSLFTYYLLKGLLGEANTNHNSFVTIGELFHYTYKNVVDYSSKLSNVQHPIIWGRFNESTAIIQIK